MPTKTDLARAIIEKEMPGKHVVEEVKVGANRDSVADAVKATAKSPSLKTLRSKFARKDTLRADAVRAEAEGGVPSSDDVVVVKVAPTPSKDGLSRGERPKNVLVDVVKKKIIGFQG